MYFRCNCLYRGRYLVPESISDILFLGLLYTIRTSFQGRFSLQENVYAAQWSAVQNANLLSNFLAC